MFLIFLNFFPASSHSLNLNSSITSSSMYITYWTFLNDPVPSASIIFKQFISKSGILWFLLVIHGILN